MPIFDFACQQCDHEFEKLVMRRDAPAPKCTSCDSEDVKQQVSAPAFRLAGSGWYETDFKTGKKKNLASNDADTAPKKADTAPKKADAAPKKAAAAKDSSSAG